MKFKHGIFQQLDVVNLKKNGEITKVKKGKYIIISIDCDEVATLVSIKCKPLGISFDDKNVNIKICSKDRILAKIPKIPVNNKTKFLTET